MTWHPILAAVEHSPGRWQMVGQLEQIYGDIETVRGVDELGYRADCTNKQGSRPTTSATTSPSGRPAGKCTPRSFARTERPPATEADTTNSPTYFRRWGYL
jgi:hypothetical protein